MEGGQLQFVPTSTETIQHSAAANGGSGLVGLKTYVHAVEK
jgi:hypothetical protein